ncbi:dockerin type I domain-containing protein [Porcipelethomonas sp.]|uniref:dockerin type I domain-containing protein n=1 Tax=Porcipelethomonas sp. TaxID=2981675 RepID=UPI003EF99D71
MKFTRKCICIAASLLMALSSMEISAGADTEIQNPSLKGDINADGYVDVYDSLLLNEIILNNTYDESADINSDGTVDENDSDELYKYIISEEHIYKESDDDGNKIFLSETETSPGSTASLQLKFDENTDAQAAAVVIEYPNSLTPDEKTSFSNAEITNFEDGKITAVFADVNGLESELSSLDFIISDDEKANTIYDIKLYVISFGNSDGDFEKISIGNGIIQISDNELSTEPSTEPLLTDTTQTDIQSETTVTAVSSVSASDSASISTVTSFVTTVSSTTGISISIDLSEIEKDNKLQWYKSSEKEFFRDGIKIYIDGKEISAANKIYFNTTPKSTYNGETFDYVIPFTVEYNNMIIASTFNAKIGKDGDTNLDHCVDDSDIEAAIKWINYEQSITEFQQFLLDKNNDGDVDYSDISYTSNKVSYILYSDHAEAIDCDSSATSIVIPSTIKMLPVTKISGTFFGMRGKLKSLRINNPDCEIENVDNAISINTTIYGYTDSAAQIYAQEFGKKFVAIDTRGDANSDGIVNVQDAALIARKVAQQKNSELPSWSDYNEDSQVNIRDAAAIAKYVANKYSG